ncbi:MAG: hypothetical protein WAK71_07300 [Streptosporangiaceae bacterium]|jgi:hypothetical protein
MTVVTGPERSTRTAGFGAGGAALPAGVRLAEAGLRGTAVWETPAPDGTGPDGTGPEDT